MVSRVCTLSYLRNPGWQVPSAFGQSRLASLHVGSLCVKENRHRPRPLQVDSRIFPLWNSMSGVDPVPRCFLQECSFRTRMALLLSNELTAVPGFGGAQTARAYVTARQECLVFMGTIHCINACRVACGRPFSFYHW
jgi:hypothetical protein